MLPLFIIFGLLILAGTACRFLAADKPNNVELGEFSEYPVLAAVNIYEGAMIGLQVSSGYARPLETGDVFVGHAMDRADNTSGANGAIRVKVRVGIYRSQQTITSVAVTDVDKPVFASADDTLTLTQSTNVRVGRVARHVGTNTFVVEFQTSPGTVAHIPNPSGGATIDAEARTAINAILVALESYGIVRNA